MLITLPNPKTPTREEARENTVKKSAAVSERIFNVMSDLSYLTEAMDSAVLGDSSELDSIYAAISDLNEYLRDPELRIRPVSKSGILKLCQATLVSLESDDIKPEKLQDAWGRCYATFLTTYEKQQSNPDRAVYIQTLAADTAADVNKIPHTVGRNGFVVTRLPLIFTTHVSILSNLRHFPPNFNATQWAGGYLFQDQLIVGVEAEGKQQQEIVDMINAVIGAYKAEGKAMVNVLGAGRKYCYFWHSDNPLAFAWLMPESIYSKCPLRVNNVKINVNKPEPEMVVPALTTEEKLKKNQRDREQFETFVKCDKEYARLMEQVNIDRRLKDIKSAAQHTRQAERRKEALRLQWVKGVDADPLVEQEQEQPHVRVPVKVQEKPIRTPIANKTLGRLTIKSGRVKQGKTPRR